MSTPLKLGTRGSPLALWQAERVRDAIQKKTGLSCEIEVFRTRAENFPDQTLAAIGVGVFTKELDDALIRGDIDLAVHSAKDMPSELDEGIRLAAFTERASPLDSFVGANDTKIADLPEASRIGTGSPRRKSQLLALRPDLIIVPLRGNVATRLRKIRDEGLAGTILAEAGLTRLGKRDVITEVFSTESILPAVGQGAIAVATRPDGAAADAVAQLDDADVRACVETERAFLRQLRGGCQAPAAAHAQLVDEQIFFRALIADLDGSRVLRGESRGTREEAPTQAAAIAKDLLAQGGEDILRALREDNS